MKSPRRRAREFALQGIYQWQMNGAGALQIEAHLAEAAGFDKADLAFFQRLLRGTLGAAEALQPVIEPHLDRPYGELSPIERGVLLLATFELREHLEAPYKVVINEAIELAKAYGGTDGHKYVNGVLDKLAAGLRPDEVSRPARRSRSNAKEES